MLYDYAKLPTFISLWEVIYDLNVHGGICPRTIGIDPQHPYYAVNLKPTPSPPTNTEEARGEKP